MANRYGSTALPVKEQRHALASTRLADKWIALLSAGYSLGLTIWLLATHASTTIDDGLFYFQVARHLARGVGSTFDGINLTNGYHPLWLLCLVPIFWFTSDPFVGLNAGAIVQGLLMAASSVLLYGIARSQLRWPVALVTVLVWLKLTYALQLSGLEYSLHTCGLLALIFLYLRWFSTVGRSPTPAQAFILGLFASLTFLARLETLLLWLILLIQFGWRQTKPDASKRSINRVVAFALPTMLVVLVYLIVNHLSFGHILPISGVIKQDWSASVLSQSALYRAYGWWAAKAANLLWPLRPLDEYTFFVMAGVVGPTIFWLLVQRKGDVAGGRWRRAVALCDGWTPFILYSVGNYLAYAFIYHAHYTATRWYYVMQPCLACLLTGLLIESVIETRAIDPLLKWAPTSKQTIATTGSVLFCLWLAVTTVQSTKQWQVPANRGVAPIIEVIKSLPTDARLASWNPGAFSYYSGRSVVSLDGLMNSWEYFLDKRADLCRYWREMRVSYLIDLFTRGPDQQPVPVYPPAPAYHQYASCVADLELIWQDQRYPALWRVELYRYQPQD